MPEFNILAVIAASVGSFLLGGVWYSAIFQKPWAREAWGPLEESHRPKPKHPGVVFGVSFVLIFIAALVFAVFLGPAPELGFAIGAGASAGLCWVATSFGVNYLFCGRSAKLWLIDAGYNTLQFTLFGLVLGLWH